MGLLRTLGPPRLTASVVCAMALAAGALIVAPGTTAQGCPPGHITNPYNGQCYVPSGTPIINGIPCVASNLGLCQSFVQNQQPPRRPFTSVG